VQVLPYLEMSTVFNHFDFDLGVYAPKNLAPQQRSISVYVCPSDVLRPLANGRHASSYAGCHSGKSLPIDVDQDGVLYLNSSVRYEDIPDGSTFTIAVGEKIVGDEVWGWASGTRDTLRNTGIGPNGGGLALYQPPVTYSPEGEMLGDEENAGEDTADAKTAQEKLLEVGGFSSRHTGGVQVGMCDGSVRFISQSVAPTVFSNLGSRNDGEMLTDF
jgi:prepilin-type processing-associated H-X9-DG protein